MTVGIEDIVARYGVAWRGARASCNVSISSLSLSCVVAALGGTSTRTPTEGSACVGVGTRLQLPNHHEVG